MTREKARSKGRGRTVYSVHYAFEAPGGKRYKGVSYGSGPLPAVGEFVPIEYFTEDPGLSAIKGMRVAPISFLAYVAVFLFPVAGIILAGIRFVGGMRNVALLERGVVTEGELVSNEPTASKVNGRRVHRLTFAFATAAGEKRTVTTRSAEPEKLAAPGGASILYLPDEPSRANALEATLNPDDVDEQGNLRASAGAAVAVCILPVLAAVGWIAFFVFRMP